MVCQSAVYTCVIAQPKAGSDNLSLSECPQDLRCVRTMKLWKPKKVP